VRFNSIFGVGWSYTVIMTTYETFTSAVTAKIARVTLATLDNWSRRGILAPSIAAPAPHPRRYTFRDLVAIRVLVALRDAGIDLGGLRRVVEYLRKRKGLSATEALASTVLITDGRDVYEVEEDVRISALRKPGQAVFHVVALSTLVSEIQRDARAAQHAA
jgi:DNA-binding transcriptional MerR regulator